ncbi:nucleotidyltransferase domain-containing protein [Alkalihalobacillus sp. AL-G]|uniref:nucleotidyltransferase domain-containing protein n=1 Tax=Alkalihalobacillus sp. AL-G TaxID=2926399 RepID=UPI00272A7559|nr:nucleotidyltransferase domain-containing protein [Alkalihalobacillus sp. AL-G]WLD94586.1 nucleotidyltransferase domain-containing protein [Alkalihalobacillus sp. AL-G]
MTNPKRPEPLEAAELFVQKKFPNCQRALLAGSAARNELTETSDLDIVIFDNGIPSSYRESLIEFDWPIEVFAHNLTSYKTIFRSDFKRARPSMQRMVSEGLTLKDDGRMNEIKAEAKRILDDGPEKWSKDTIMTKRYFITDAVDDLIGATNRAEELFIVNTLADLLHEFILRTNGCWLGSSKWVIRELTKFNSELATCYFQALDTYYKTSDKTKLIDFTDDVLAPFGGRLFDGFTIGRNNERRQQ